MKERKMDGSERGARRAGRFGHPRNRCPVSTLDSNVALPVYRTFMAHKYQELSMISLLYYQRRSRLLGVQGTGDQKLLFGAQFYLSCPTPIRSRTR